MILVVYFLPEGIVPALRRWWEDRREADAVADVNARASTEPVR
jgi:hypothetical protein